MAKSNENKAPTGTTGASAPVTGADDDMQEWQGQFGGNVDGWWSPPKDVTASFRGILVSFIDKNRSEKLQSNSLVFEVLETTEYVKNGGSDKMPGSKGDNKLHKAPKGCMVAVSEWKQFIGAWPAKAGHEFSFTRQPQRDIGKGRKMYDVKPLKVSGTPRRHIEISEVDPTDEVVDAQPDANTNFQVEAEA
jgi:hypothetical protein